MGPEAILQSAESERPQRCPDCGIPHTIQEDDEACPVCLLRRAMQLEATVEDLLDEDRFIITRLCGAPTAVLTNWAGALWGSPTVASIRSWVTPWR